MTDDSLDKVLSYYYIFFSKTKMNMNEISSFLFTVCYLDMGKK